MGSLPRPEAHTEVPPSRISCLRGSRNDIPLVAKDRVAIASHRRNGRPDHPSAERQLTNGLLPFAESAAFSSEPRKGTTSPIGPSSLRKSVGREGLEPHSQRRLIYGQHGAHSDCDASFLTIPSASAARCAQFRDESVAQLVQQGTEADPWLHRSSPPLAARRVPAADEGPAC
jgi:hypothetical protein